MEDTNKSGKGYRVKLDVGYCRKDLRFDGYGGSLELEGDSGSCRIVDTDGPIDVSAEVSAPHDSCRIAVDKDGLYASGRHSSGKAEFHVDDVGGKLEGPSVSYKFEVGKNGVNARYENTGWSTSFSFGSFKASVGKGSKAALRADSSGVGAIVPPYGGGIISEDGIEASYGDWNGELNWNKEIKEKEK